MIRYQLYRGFSLKGRVWRWRLKSRNGEIIAHGESYSRRIDAERAIQLVKDSADAPVDTIGGAYVRT